MASPQEKFMEAYMLHANKEYGAAIEKLNTILVDHPDMHMSWSLRGTVLRDLRHPFDAIINYDKAIELAPEIASYWNNRGVSHLELNMFEEAVADFDAATRLNPRLEQTYNNKGNTLRRMMRIADAEKEYRAALAVNPEYIDAHLGLSFCLLEQGKFEEGWEEFEWRWKSDQLPPRNMPFPNWEGEKAENHDDILIMYAEQGYGDALQFMRFGPLVKKAWGGKLAIEVKQPLHRLMKTIDGIDDVYMVGDKLPDAKFCLASMSAPRLLKTMVDTIPANIPYFHTNDHLIGLWRERLKVLPVGRLVGICWAGMNRPFHQVAELVDRARSLAFKDFTDLAGIKGISWVSLQKGPPASQVKEPPRGMSILDPQDDLHDFYDTAALIECLDLVITVDTSVAHLAAALGKPTWMLSRYDGCWRWMGFRSDSPWYPSLRQFRQSSIGDWDFPMRQLEQELRSFVKVSEAA